MNKSDTMRYFANDELIGNSTVGCKIEIFCPVVLTKSDAIAHCTENQFGHHAVGRNGETVCQVVLTKSGIIVQVAKEFGYDAAVVQNTESDPCFEFRVSNPFRVAPVGSMGFGKDSWFAFLRWYRIIFSDRYLMESFRTGGRERFTKSLGHLS